MQFIKPKFWDLKKPNFLVYLLYPFTIFVKINNIISSLRPKRKFAEIKTICVGNLYIGGTGKTPTTLFLYNLLKKMNINLATAKKFYNNQIDEQKFLRDNSNFISLKLVTISLTLLSINAPLSLNLKGILTFLILRFDFKIGDKLIPSIGVIISELSIPVISAIVGNISIVDAG